MKRIKLPPSTTASNGRNASGTFAPGNKFSQGFPHASKIAKLRSALLGAVTPEDVAEVIQALLKRAKRGEVSAATLLFTRLLGNPVEADLLERIENLEQRLSQRFGGSNEFQKAS